MSDCIFCKIASGEIPTQSVYQDDKVIVFKDLNPQAPVHVLLIPKKHYSSLNEITQKDEALVGYILHKAAEIAAQLGIAEGGYRLVINTNEDGGQSVPHLHFHLLGGRKLGWPPG